MVYAAFGIFILGTAIRIIKIRREPKHPTTLQIYPEQKPKWLWTLNDTFLFPTVRRHYPVHWIFLMLFHICFFLLIIGHFELIDNYRILQIIEHEILKTEQDGDVNKFFIKRTA